MDYSIYHKRTGHIERVVSCDISQLSAQFDGDTHAYMQGRLDDSTVYIADGIQVTLPERPGQHWEFNWETKQWEDPRTLQDLKDAQWAMIKQARSQSEYAGFMWDGSKFDSDAISQNRITGAVSLAMMSPEFTIGWTLFDNTVRTLNQTDMLQVGAALGAHVATQFAKGVILREQINAATTSEEVEAVVW